MEKFIFSIQENFCEVIDTENQVICRFEKSKFNETQVFDYPEDLLKIKSITEISAIPNKIAEFLIKNHKEVI